MPDLELTQDNRDWFDSLVARELEDLPPGPARRIEEIAVVVEDFPSREILGYLAEDVSRGEDGDVLGNKSEGGAMTLEEACEELCGLHIGVADTERSVEAAEASSVIYLFRLGIISLAGGLEADEEEVAEQIRITILHELGHQYGLSEADLEDLGYE